MFKMSTQTGRPEHMSGTNVIKANTFQAPPKLIMIIHLFWRGKASQQHCSNVLDLRNVLTDMSRNTSFEEAPLHMTNVGQYS